MKCDSWHAVMKYVYLSLFQAHLKGSQSERVTFIGSSTISDSPGESRSNESLKRHSNKVIQTILPPWRKNNDHTVEIFLAHARQCSHL